MEAQKRVAIGGVASAVGATDRIRYSRCGAADDISVVFPTLLCLCTLPAITLSSTGDSASIFEGEKPKPAIYKIQNLYSETHLDIHRHPKEVLCRPARDLEEGRGLVRPFSWSVVRESDNCK